MTNNSDVGLNPSRVLVLGASGGLGKAITADLHGRGNDLALVGRDLSKIAPSFISMPQLSVDLRSPEACEQALNFAVECLGGLDVVVNCVGVVAFSMIEELSLETLEELFLTNTFIPFWIAKSSLAKLNKGGMIVNISGVIAEQNLPGMGAYGSSKAAVKSLSQALSREARRKGIKVLDARPPHTETGLTSRPIEGSAPNMPQGLDPAYVAQVIGDAIASGATELPSASFES